MVVSTAEKDLYRCKVEELAHRGFTMKLGIYVGFRPKPTDYLFGSCRGISRDSRAKKLYGDFRSKVILGKFYFPP